MPSFGHPALISDIAAASAAAIKWPRMLRPCFGLALIILGTLSPSRAADKGGGAPPLAVPAWLFPGEGSASPGDPPDWPEDNPFRVKDWHPATHPPMPPIVSAGRAPDVFACGYCHLPDGSGRPENASVAGLPAAYIERQIQAFISGARRSAAPSELAPTHYMIETVRHATAAELATAAGYFAELSFPRKVRVVEAGVIPRPRVREFLYFLDTGGARERLGRRLIEAPLDPAAHARHDGAARYIAYVPIGSLARGRALAAAGPGGPATACILCHGAGLHGGPTATPLAGRSPSGLMRQLLAFRNGARVGPIADLMRPVVANLTIDDMIALSAYAAASAP